MVMLRSVRQAPHGVARLFRGIPAMRESDTYQMILEEGLERGLERSL
jgi:hypothetical protein